MTKLQWQSQLIWFIEKDPFKFMFLQLGRLLVCLIVGHVSISLCPNQWDWLKTALQGVVISAAALPSLYKIVKHTKAHLHMGAFTVLHGIFVGCIYFGVMDTTFFSTESSISASQVIWQSLFMVLGLIEFYVCGRSQRDESHAKISEPVVLEHNRDREFNHKLKVIRSWVSCGAIIVLTSVLTSVCVSFLVYCVNHSLKSGEVGFKTKGVLRND